MVGWIRRASRLLVPAVNFAGGYPCCAVAGDQCDNCSNGRLPANGFEVEIGGFVGNGWCTNCLGHNGVYPITDVYYPPLGPYECWIWWSDWTNPADPCTATRVHLSVQYDQPSNEGRLLGLFEIGHDHWGARKRYYWEKTQQGKWDCQGMNQLGLDYSGVWGEGIELCVVNNPTFTVTARN